MVHAFGVICQKPFAIPKVREMPSYILPSAAERAFHRAGSDPREIVCVWLRGGPQAHPAVPWDSLFSGTTCDSAACAHVPACASHTRSFLA